MPPVFVCCTVVQQQQQFAEVRQTMDQQRQAEEQERARCVCLNMVCFSSQVVSQCKLDIFLHCTVSLLENPEKTEYYLTLFLFLSCVRALFVCDICVRVRTLYTCITCVWVWMYV